MESTKEYPTMELQRIVPRLKSVYEKFQDNPITIVKLANTCGYSYPKNGTARSFLSSCISYGLLKIDYKDNLATLTPSFVEILKKEAFSHEDLLKITTTPKIFDSIHRYFQPEQIPFRPEIIHFLQSYCSFSDYTAKNVAKTYHSTIEYVFSFIRNNPSRNQLRNNDALVFLSYEKPHSYDELLQIVTNMIEEKRFEESQLIKGLQEDFLKS